jgi:hypothetical protein
MYFIYFKDTMELIASFARGSRAIMIGKALSRAYGRETVAVHNGNDGSTEQCCDFSKGNHTVVGPFSPLPYPDESGDDWTRS